MSFGKGNLATLSYLLETCFKEAMEAIKCVMREVMWNFVLIFLWGLVKLFLPPLSGSVCSCTGSCAAIAEGAIHEEALVGMMVRKWHRNTLPCCCC